LRGKRQIESTNERVRVGVGEKRQKTALTHALHTQLRRERRIQEQHKSEAAASNIGGARRWIGGTAYGSYQQDSYKVSSLPPNPTCRAMLPLFNAFSCVFAPPCMMTCECAAALGKSSLPHLHDTVDIASPVPFASKTQHEDESSLHTHTHTHTHAHMCSSGSTMKRTISTNLPHDGTVLP
jgi:hypothetical protein